jgi:hypothetical protein
MLHSINKKRMLLLIHSESDRTVDSTLKTVFLLVQLLVQMCYSCRFPTLSVSLTGLRKRIEFMAIMMLSCPTGLWLLMRDTIVGMDVSYEQLNTTLSPL